MDITIVNYRLRAWRLCTLRLHQTARVRSKPANTPNWLNRTQFWRVLHAKVIVVLFAEFFIGFRGNVIKMFVVLIKLKRLFTILFLYIIYKVCFFCTLPVTVYRVVLDVHILRTDFSPIYVIETSLLVSASYLYFLTDVVL